MRIGAVVLVALVLVVAACGDAESPVVVTEGDRVQLSLAFVDDPGRRAALYAFEQGIVTAETVDLDIRYLPQSAIGPAAASKQFDVIEQDPLALPLAGERGPDFIVLSGGLRSLDATFLFVRASDDVRKPRDLVEKSVGVASLTAASTVETRFLLQESYRLDGSDLPLEELPASSLPDLLRDGEVAAAVLLDEEAFRLLGDDRFRTLNRVTEEVRELTGMPVLSSVLLTYRDVVAQKSDALREIKVLLAESLAYFRANEELVIEAVANKESVDPEFLQWWWESHELPLGDLERDVQEQLLQAWQVGVVLGEIDEIPGLADVLFVGKAPTPEPED